MDDKSRSEQILIEDLEERIQANSERLAKKVNVKGETMTDIQLENLAVIIKAQSERLKTMKEKYEKSKLRKTKKKA